METNREQLDRMEKKMDSILNSIARIEHKMGSLDKSCGNMDEHINFVNGVYTTVRSPLQWVVDRTTTLMGSDGKLEGNEIKQLPYK